MLSSVLVAMTGCAPGQEGKGEVIEDFSDLAGIDQKSDGFQERLLLLGKLAGDQLVENIAYTETPRFRAFEFEGFQGNDIEIWVRSPDGDAIAWLLDGNFQELAKVDDSAETPTTTTRDARIRLRLAATGTYYVVFRELDLQPATFSVSLKGAYGPAPDDLEAFNALPAEAKMKGLFPGYARGAEAVDYELAEGFSEVPVRLVELEDPDLRRRALDVYFQTRDFSFQNGGDAPLVTAVVKNGLTYAYIISSAGRSYGNWVSVQVYDAAFNEIGGWGYAD